MSSVSRALQNTGETIYNKTREIFGGGAPAMEGGASKKMSARKQVFKKYYGKGGEIFRQKRGNAKLSNKELFGKFMQAGYFSSEPAKKSPKKAAKRKSVKKASASVKKSAKRVSAAKKALKTKVEAVKSASAKKSSAKKLLRTSRSVAKKASAKAVSARKAAKRAKSPEQKDKTKKALKKAVSAKKKAVSARKSAVKTLKKVSASVKKAKSAKTKAKKHLKKVSPKKLAKYSVKVKKDKKMAGGCSNPSETFTPKDLVWMSDADDDSSDDEDNSAAMWGGAANRLQKAIKKYYGKDGSKYRKERGNSNLDQGELWEKFLTKKYPNSPEYKRSMKTKSPRRRSASKSTKRYSPRKASPKPRYRQPSPSPELKGSFYQQWRQTNRSRSPTKLAYQRFRNRAMLDGTYFSRVSPGQAAYNKALKQDYPIYRKMRLDANHKLKKKRILQDWYMKWHEEQQAKGAISVAIQATPDQMIKRLDNAVESASTDPQLAKVLVTTGYQTPPMETLRAEVPPLDTGVIPPALQTPVA